MMMTNMNKFYHLVMSDHAFFKKFVFFFKRWYPFWYNEIGMITEKNQAVEQKIGQHIYIH